MALKLKYTDEHGILHIDMSPAASPREPRTPRTPRTPRVQPPTPRGVPGQDINGNGNCDIDKPKFDTINNRFSQYDLFGGKYDSSSGEEKQSLFRSRYNSIEEELANTPYAFTTQSGLIDVSIDREISPSKDIEDDRFFTKTDDLFGPVLGPAFSVKQLIHAQDRYFDLSKKSDVSAGAFRVLSAGGNEAVLPVVPTAKRKRESSFAIVAEPPSRPGSPRSLPDARQGRVSPFRGRGFREETSRHNTPKTSAANSLTNSRATSRANSPPRRRTHSLSRIDKMATQVALPPPIVISRPQSPRNFVKQNIEEVRELSELNREKHEAEAERKRIEEEEALLREMGLNGKSSRVSSRASSPNKKGRSRSNSPTAILHFEPIPVSIAAAEVNGITSTKADLRKVVHKSRDPRARSVSKSQPQSNNGSPKSKIPKRQNSVSPNRNNNKKIENNLSKNQRFISNSTSSIHETIKIGSTVHDKRVMSKSSNNLHISPAHIRSKPPISPGRGGPPPSNKAISTKRLSPIVGTPNKSPIEDLKSPKQSLLPKKPVKTADNAKTQSTVSSRVNSRQTNRSVSRDQSPDKRKTVKAPPKPANKPVDRTPSSRAPKPPVPKNDAKKPITRTNSVKNLVRAPSTKTLNEKPPMLKKKDSKNDLTQKSQSTTKIDDVGAKKAMNGNHDVEKETKNNAKGVETDQEKKFETTGSGAEEVSTQDNETQYDKITNDKGELVILTKKNIVSMTTAAITAQPLEVVTTVTNQLPAAFEKAREKGIFERHSSKDSLAPKNDDKIEPADDEKVEERKPVKAKPIFTDDNIKLKPLQPPYNNPQVERVKQKIDDILKAPEVSPENILASATNEVVSAKTTFKNVADKTKNEIKQGKDDVMNRIVDVKDQAVQQKAKAAEEIRNEAAKIVNSIITPVEEPKDLKEMVKTQVKKDIEPIVMVVNERNGPKMTETLVKGEAEMEVQSSNLSTPGKEKFANLNKLADAGSDRSSHNGGFPQSTSTTPKPPPRAPRTGKISQSDKQSDKQSEKLQGTGDSKEPMIIDSSATIKKENICKRFLDKCAQKTKCCACCVKAEDDEMKKQDGAQMASVQDAANTIQDGGPTDDEKTGFMSKFSCCKRKDKVEEEMKKEIEKAVGKQPSIEFDNELPTKRTVRDILCCRGSRRISDASARSPAVLAEAGCCGRRRDVERRDSVLSDREPTTCCNNRLFNWARGACRRRELPSRRASMFSKNKSLSPTLPPEDTRTKLDPTLVEHTSVMRAAIPVLPIVLAHFCLASNVLVPGLGTIFSGMFCLCFGIPRFGPHDGAKYRIGALLINILVGLGQLFTVLFCLVGWGWSIWWGVIMLRLARKYRRLRTEAEDAEQPPVTGANHAT